RDVLSEDFRGRLCPLRSPVERIQLNMNASENTGQFLGQRRFPRSCRSDNRDSLHYWNCRLFILTRGRARGLLKPSRLLERNVIVASVEFVGRSRPMCTVREILSNKGTWVASIEPQASALEAVRSMNHHKVGSLMVMDGERVVGILSERDLLERVLAEQLDPA